MRSLCATLCFLSFAHIRTVSPHCACERDSSTLDVDPGSCFHFRAPDTRVVRGWDAHGPAALQD